MSTSETADTVRAVTEALSGPTQHAVAEVSRAMYYDGVGGLVFAAALAVAGVAAICVERKHRAFDGGLYFAAGGAFFLAALVVSVAARSVLAPEGMAILEILKNR